MKLDWIKKHIKHKRSIYFESCNKKEGLTNKFQICDRDFGRFGENTIIGVSQNTIKEKKNSGLFSQYYLLFYWASFAVNARI